jgi:RNA polymerase sigma-70 factor (ECF subfamily)
MVTDDDLVRRFQRGDDVAFSTFVARHQDRLFRLARVWLADAEDAPDVVQEVLMRSYTGLRRFAFRAQPTTWLVRTTRNVCHEFNRRRPAMSNALAPEPIAPETPDHYHSRRQIAGKVHRLIARLPDRQRDVVVLRLFEELSVADTARVMGCRPGTVKALLHKAVARLQVLTAHDGKEALV